MKRYIAIIPALCLLVSCADRSTWTPGPKDSPYSNGVYFDEDTPVDLVISPEEAGDVEIQLHRVRTNAAKTVPIKAECNIEGVKFPESVRFAAGSADATIVIDCTALPERVMAKYSIHIPDEQVYLYNDSRYNSFSGSILISKWENANNDESDVTFIFTSSDYVQYYNSTPVPKVYKSYQSKMEVLPGAGRYRINDFMGGKSDFVFTLKESPYKDSDYEGGYRIMPLDDYYYPDPYYGGDKNGNLWYLCANPDSDYEPVVEGYAKYHLKDIDDDSDIVITYPEFYWYSDAGEMEYSWARLAGTSVGEGDDKKEFDKCVASMCGWGWWEGSASYIYFEWDKVVD